MSEINQQDSKNYPGTSNTFYGNEQGRLNMYQNAMQTKSDFPTIMTRGKVTENRLDLELESKGSIF